MPARVGYTTSRWSERPHRTPAIFASVGVSAFQNMDAYETKVDQYAYGLKARDRYGRIEGPMKKPTNVRMTK